MKGIPLIMSLFFFCLAIMPCSDAMTCDEDAIELSHNHDHGEDEKDDCTPLCVCACCGVIYTFPKVLSIQLHIRLPMIEVNSFYVQSYSFVYQGTIWHPPAQC